MGLNMPKRLKTEAHPNWINNYLYEAIYATESSEFPFTIHNKKLQEAEALFESSIMQASTKTLITIKGPPGCGKGFLFAHLRKKFGHVAQFSEFDSQETTMDWRELAQEALPVQCSTSIFPPLPLIPLHSTPKKQKQKQISVLRLTDAHFQVKEVRRMVDQLRAFNGVLLVEFTESEFEDSTAFYALKLLKETFSDRFFTLNLNACARQVMRKSLTPMVSAAFPGDLDAVMEKCFRGDARAFLHDLFMATLLPTASLYSFPPRDYRTDFFHYLGKLLYPAKSDQKIFDEESFWDLELEGVFLFVQYYLAVFVPEISALSEALDSLSSFDSVSWRVKNNVSLLQHPCNALHYSTLLSIYRAINCTTTSNSGNQAQRKHSMFSFSKPPTIHSSNSRRLRHADEQFILEQIKSKV